MLSDNVIQILKTVASVFASLFFITIALWNGTREILLRRKKSRVAEWLKREALLDSRWRSPDELQNTARNLCREFFDAFNAGDDEKLRNIMHPEAWEEFSRDLRKIRNNAKERRLMNFDATKTALCHLATKLDHNERSFVVQLDLTGHYEIWRSSGLARKRFSILKEFWEFRTHLGEWRLFNRHGSVAWIRFVGGCYE